MTIRALITGATGDLGKAMSIELAKMGYHIIIHTHQNPKKAETLSKAIEAVGATWDIIQFDITSDEQTDSAIHTLLKDGPIQVLINNAGVHQDVPMAGMEAQAWHRVMDVSLHGFYRVTQPLLLPMMQTRWGRIINISSIAATTGNRGQVNYSAAKAGLQGATKSLALEVASRNITVNTIAPGVIEGSMTQDNFDAAFIKQSIPMQRAGTPDEVAHLVGFIASDKANYISGQCIHINGAMV